MRSKRARTPRGLLLFEVCVAMTIMAIAVVGMLRSFSQTILVAERAREETTALRFLKEHALYALVRGSVSSAGAEGALPSGGVGGTAWRWRITTAPLDESRAPLLLTHVAVTWEQRRRPHALTVSTWLPAAE